MPASAFCRRSFSRWYRRRRSQASDADRQLGNGMSSIAVANWWPLGQRHAKSTSSRSSYTVGPDSPCPVTLRTIGAERQHVRLDRTGPGTAESSGSRIRRGQASASAVDLTGLDLPTEFHGRFHRRAVQDAAAAGNMRVYAGLVQGGGTLPRGPRHQCNLRPSNHGHHARQPCCG